MNIEQWSDLMFPDKDGKDVHVYGSVRAINADGSYEVQLNASSVTTKCTACCTAIVGDRVLVCIKADGRCAAIGRVGGDLGGGDLEERVEAVEETIETTIEARFEGIEADILDMRTNKVLWSGVYTLSADQTITLSEAVSDQPFGIVIVFSRYSTSSNAALDDNFTYFPIPKAHVSLHSGKGLRIGSIGLDSHMMKYVYLTDTQIKGYSDNTESGEAGGIDYYNYYWVVREVLGV